MPSFSVFVELELPYMPLPYCYSDPVADFDTYTKAFEIPGWFYNFHLFEFNRLIFFKKIVYG